MTKLIDYLMSDSYYEKQQTLLQNRKKNLSLIIAKFATI